MKDKTTTWVDGKREPLISSIEVHKGEPLPHIISKIKENYPMMTDEFDTILKRMFELFCKKQDDYGPSNIGLGKAILETDEDMRNSLIGLTIRMNDKIQRLLNLTLNNKEPNNESVDDTLMDIANYCVMPLIVKDKKWGK
tara:strand:+ start:78 stop:497 length:420 start_codon:yes stop_codon:yes gene_type:complete